MGFEKWFFHWSDFLENKIIGSHGESNTGCAIKRGHNALLVLSFGKALVSSESRLKQKQPAPSGEDTRPAIDFHLMIPCRIFQISLIEKRE